MDTLKRLLIPGAILGAGLFYFAAKSSVSPAVGLIKSLFGFSADAYGPGRIGYGTPAANRASIDEKTAAEETKLTVEKINNQLSKMGGQNWPYPVRMAYIVLNYFALPYAADSSVHNGVMDMITQIVNGQKAGQFTQDQLDAIESDKNTVLNDADVSDYTVFTHLFDNTVYRFTGVV